LRFPQQWSTRTEIDHNILRVQPWCCRNNRLFINLFKGSLQVWVLQQRFIAKASKLYCRANSLRFFKGKPRGIHRSTSSNRSCKTRTTSGKAGSTSAVSN
jgi:hypothetical protein